MSSDAGFITQLSWGGLLLALTLGLHALGMGAALGTSATLRERAKGWHSYAAGLGILILAVWMIVLTNLLDLSVWALFFLLQGAMPNQDAAFYHAALNYTTLRAGYLPVRWHLLEPLLGLAGLITLAWSAGILYLQVQEFRQDWTRVRQQRRERPPAATPIAPAAAGPMPVGTPPGSGLWTRFRQDDLLGVRFALNVFIASIIVWLALGFFTEASPIWALASMIASSEPVLKQGWKMFRSRLINTLVGCAVGLLLLGLGRPEPWKLPFALALTVLLASYFVRIPVMWRQAPITAAIIIAGGLTEHSKLGGAEIGLRRVTEVIFGCLVALAVSWLLARIWPMHPAPPTTPAGSG